MKILAINSEAVSLAISVVFTLKYRTLVIPVKAGIQETMLKNWIEVCAISRLHGNDGWLNGILGQPPSC